MLLPLPPPLPGGSVQPSRSPDSAAQARCARPAAALRVLAPAATRGRRPRLPPPRPPRSFARHTAYFRTDTGTGVPPAGGRAPSASAHVVNSRPVSQRRRGRTEDPLRETLGFLVLPHTLYRVTLSSAIEVTHGSSCPSWTGLTEGQRGKIQDLPRHKFLTS